MYFFIPEGSKTSHINLIQPVFAFTFSKLKLLNRVVYDLNHRSFFMSVI